MRSWKSGWSLDARGVYRAPRVSMFTSPYGCGLGAGPQSIPGKPPMHVARRLLDRQADGTGPFKSHYEEVSSSPTFNSNTAQSQGHSSGDFNDWTLSHGHLLLVHEVIFRIPLIARGCFAVTSALTSDNVSCQFASRPKSESREAGEGPEMIIGSSCQASSTCPSIFQRPLLDRVYPVSNCHGEPSANLRGRPPLQDDVASGREPRTPSVFEISM
ncbi:hypothetical protein V8D89_013474 [Ganoderma adspersum]